LGSRCHPREIHVRPGRFNVVATIVGVLFIRERRWGIAGRSERLGAARIYGAAVIVAVAASTVFAHRRVT
jgi:hypothetical protein